MTRSPHKLALALYAIAPLFLVAAAARPSTGAEDPAAEKSAAEKSAAEKSGQQASSAGAPNIVFILADDMGYGDVAALNPASTIPTPNLDRLAAEGMTFTDAHSPSAVCTPTRYATLTGRYCWRSRLKRGVLGGYSPPLIDEDRSTVATMLSNHGYVTGAVGKWHLGMNMARREGGAPKQDRWQGDGNVDFSKPIADGPTTRGFDYYFGVSASFDMAPYVWIENGRFTMEPSKQFPGKPFPAFARPGPQAEDVKFDEALDKLAEKASAFIAKHAAGEKPFFLYLPLTGPHKPVVPHSRFTGKTELGPYGDFIVNVDNAVGQVLKAIDDANVADETLLIYTSDNGSFMYRYDEPRKDHVADAGVQGYNAEHHRANGPFRGTKADIWEAGHHVPFFVRWPQKVKAGAKCEQPICHVDLYATAAAIVGAKLNDDEAQDSFSLLPLLLGEPAKWSRAPVIHHSVAGMFAIRDGKWKLVAGNGSGGRERPRGKPFARPYMLFDLSSDSGEARNVIDEYPEVAKRLEARLEAIRKNGRSRE